MRTIPSRRSLWEVVQSAWSRARNAKQVPPELASASSQISSPVRGRMCAWLTYDWTELCVNGQPFFCVICRGKPQSRAVQRTGAELKVGCPCANVAREMHNNGAQHGRRYAGPARDLVELRGQIAKRLVGKCAGDSVRGMRLKVTSGMVPRSRWRHLLIGNCVQRRRQWCTGDAIQEWAQVWFADPCGDLYIDKDRIEALIQVDTISCRTASG